MDRIIFHIDIDAFFASVEENLNLNFRNKPLIVIGRHRKSVVSCANYPARAYGIHSAMPVFKALEKYPQVKMVNVHMDIYEKVSQKFKDFLMNNVSYQLEDFSIDECFVDVTHCVANFEEAIKYAKEVQDLVYRDLNLSISIGISNNKFLSKMATDMKKPKGITLLLQNHVKDKIWPLKIEKMLWIGKSSKERLNKLGIKFIKDLANFKDINLLKPIFGKNTQRFIQNAWGYGDNYVNNKSFLTKSISISKTLFENTDNSDELQKEIILICKDLYKKLWNNKMTGITLTLGLKTNKWEYKTKSITKKSFILSENQLINESLNLFNKLFIETSIRLISISVSNLKLISEIKMPINLFKSIDDNEDKWIKPLESFKNIQLKNKNELSEIVDKVNEKIGKNILGFAKDLS